MPGARIPHIATRICILSVFHPTWLEIMVEKRLHVRPEEFHRKHL